LRLVTRSVVVWDTILLLAPLHLRESTRVTHQAFLFLLKRVLLADLLFDLFESLEKELLNFTPLVEDNLGKGAYISKFFVFHAKILPRIDNLFPLVLNYRLVLISNHLLFFFKVRNDLSETLFENLNFVLIGFDFVGLHGLTLGVLLFSTLVDCYISLDLPIFLFLQLNYLLSLFKLVSLRDRLQRETLIFLMNLSLDSLNGYKSDVSVLKRTYFFELLGWLSARTSQVAPRIRFQFQASFEQGQFGFHILHA
jgi:hypothetical protein